MKRSEMINIILDKITELHGQKMGHDFDCKLVELILETVEREGMLPPFTYSNYIQEFHKYGIGAANGHKWEPEDE